MRKIQHILFFTFLISLTGFGGEVMATTDDTLLSCIRESKELRESEESCAHHPTFEDQKIRYKGAGGSGLEEPDFQKFSKKINQNLPADFSFIISTCTRYFSIHTYYTQLFQTLYLPKLYILFHCTKAFLF